MKKTIELMLKTDQYTLRELSQVIFMIESKEDRKEILKRLRKLEIMYQKSVDYLNDLLKV
jgi:hypothetical protein